MENRNAALLAAIVANLVRDPAKPAPGIEDFLPRFDDVPSDDRADYLKRRVQELARKK